MNYPQGSEWRKWDLHVHTPASIYHNYPGSEQEAWAAFLDNIERLPQEFKVLGINDYLFIDGYKRILAEKAEGRLDNIDLILPVVELRLDKFSGHDSQFKRVNFHVIFDQIDPTVIETQFIARLPNDFKLLPDNEALAGRWSAVPTRQSLSDLGRMIIDAAPSEKRQQYDTPLREGFNNFNASLERVKEALGSPYFKNRHITAVGKAEWSAIKWNDASIAEKRNVIHSASIVFTAGENAEAVRRARAALQAANVNSTLLDCSDAHHLSDSADKDRLGNCATWIKADTTFAGLQHAVKEYQKRVFVGDIPDKMVRVSSNQTKYLKSLSIKKQASATLQEKWFDCDIPLNHDLVAIIGNKGSGKSALADTIGLVGDTRQFKHFSFLNERKFCDPKERKADSFETTATWVAGFPVTRPLGHTPLPTSVETIKYLPQNYIETLCNEIDTGEDSDFDSELKQIIFGHVTSAERLGYASLDTLLEYLTAQTTSNIRLLAEDIHVRNEAIAKLEEQSTKAHRSQLDAQLLVKRAELAAHDASDPEPQPEPEQSEELRAAAAIIRLQLEAKQNELRGHLLESRSHEKAVLDWTRRAAVLKRAITLVETFRSQVDGFKRSLESELKAFDEPPAILFDDIATVSLVLQPLEERLSECTKHMVQSSNALDPKRTESPKAKADAAIAEVQLLQDSLDEPNRRFVAYRSAKDAWEAKRLAILGDSETANTVRWLERRIADLDVLPAQLQEAREGRLEVTRRIYAGIAEICDSYRALYKPVQDFVERNKIASESVPLTFEASITDEGFAEAFLDKLNRQVRGSFSGIEESNAAVRQFLNAADFNDPDSTLRFVERIVAALHTDQRGGANVGVEVAIGTQIKRTESVVSVYDFLYSLAFLAPRYTLKYGGNEIHQLSPGERGLLLLVFYLLIDKDDVPLVIDQPEENLDNQTIFDVLVKCLSEAKDRRQVIIVTHNPNVAVVCDAEQVIFAKRTAGSNVVEYVSGAIENPLINRHILNVLEGTRPAFDNRESKYF